MSSSGFERYETNQQEDSGSFNIRRRDNRQSGTTSEQRLDRYTRLLRTAPAPESDSRHQQQSGPQSEPLLNRFAEGTALGATAAVMAIGVNALSESGVTVTGLDAAALGIVGGALNTLSETLVQHDEAPSNYTQWLQRSYANGTLERHEGDIQVEDPRSIRGENSEDRERIFQRDRQIDQHEDRMMSVAHKLEMSVPYADIHQWRSFVEETRRQLISKRGRISPWKDDMLTDISERGTSDLASEEDRNALQYRELMTMILKRWKRVEERDRRTNEVSRILDQVGK
jgi:hypothetical protein